MSVFWLLLILVFSVAKGNILVEKQRIYFAKDGGEPSAISKPPPSLQTLSVPTLALQNVGASDTIQYVATSTETFSSTIIVYTVPEGSAYRHSPCIALRKDKL